MNKATLQRISHGDVTFGMLTFHWLPLQPAIYTIERGWHNNQTDISCIPQGLYNVTSHNTKARPNCYRLLSVPNRTGVLIHNGNYASKVGNHEPDTKGCILVGLGMDKKVPMVTSSVKALDWMRENIIGNWCIEVRNCLPPNKD